MSWAASRQGELWPLEGREGWAQAAPSSGLTDAPRRLVPPVAPSPQLFASLVGNAFAIAVVGFAIAISLGKIFALKHGYRVDSNQVWGRDGGHEGADWLPETPGPKGVVSGGTMRG